MATSACTTTAPADTLAACLASRCVPSRVAAGRHGRIRLSRSPLDRAWQCVEPRTDRRFLGAVLTCCALAEAAPVCACADLTPRRIDVITAAARQRYTPIQVLGWPARVSSHWEARWDAARRATAPRYADALDGTRLPWLDELPAIALTLRAAR
ncbi:hypothetical protein [Amycolatopsis sp. NPDC059021]|uniref:hypothetical protein n=1 Tax=Amycolatopsis sp. NPDC059021 TaxID=3346704 RepID=UPI00366F0A06